jgi:rhodanese-related sulfurtransferase
MKISMAILSSFFAISAFADEAFKLVHVSDVATWLKASTEKTYVFDANNATTRSREGVIPGATLLSSSSDYDIAKTLPTDHKAKLVFYCANEMCSASHVAAERASKAGYLNVNVLSEGIAGWRKSGQSTEKKM